MDDSQPKMYVVGCANLYDTKNGLIETLVEEFTKANIIIPDDSILPAASIAANKKTTQKQREYIARVYEETTAMLSAEKTLLCGKSKDAFTAHVQKDLEALASAEHSKQVYKACNKFSEQLTIIRPATLFGKNKEIFEYFLKALTEIDLQMPLIGEDRELRQKVFENLAYAAAIACTNPTKTHAILASTIDYVNPFDGLFGIAYSRELSVIKDGQQCNNVQKNIGNPKLSLVFCDLECENQPYIETRNTLSRTSLPAEWSELNTTKKAIIKETIKQYLGRVSVALSNITGGTAIEIKSPAEKSPEFKKRIILNDEKQHKDELTLEKIFKEPKAEIRIAEPAKVEKKDVVEKPKVQQRITPEFTINEQELILLYEGLKISENQLQKGYSENTFEPSLKRYQTIAALAMETNAKNVLAKIAQDFEMIRAYVQTKEQELKKLTDTRMSVLNEQKNKLEVEIASIKESDAKESEKIKTYFQLLSSVQGAEFPKREIVQQTCPQSAQPSAQIWSKADIIYQNICHLIGGRTPVDGEIIPKKILTAAMGIAKTGLSQIAERAQIPSEILGHAKKDRDFVFSKETINKIGAALKRTHPALLSHQTQQNQ